MVRRWSAFFCFVFAFVLSAGSAEAKKAPIPCTGDRFVAVDAPSLNAAIKRQNLHVAYRFSGCSGQEFVLYDGNNRYRSLPDQLIAGYEKETGRTLSAPSIFTAIFRAPGQFFVEWLYVLVIAGVIGWAKFKAAVEKHLPEDSKPAEPKQSAAMAAVMAAVAQKPATAVAVSRQPSSAQPRAAGFGKQNRPAGFGAPRAARAGFASGRKSA